MPNNPGTRIIGKAIVHTIGMPVVYSFEVSFLFYTMIKGNGFTDKVFRIYPLYQAFPDALPYPKPINILEMRIIGN